MTLLRLFWEFFKTGLFSVGGGLATLPFIYDISDKTGWFTHGQIADMIAVAESTPGPIGINMATYVGYTTAGVPGALCATLGIIIPPITIILIIARFLQRFRESALVDHAFYGLRPASAALIAAAGVSVVKIALLDLTAFAQSHAVTDLFRWEAIVLAAVIWLLTNVVKKTKKLHPLVFIALSAVVGVVFRFAGA
ncbi:MAG: chromate transporter [Clostridia bacterium]|nr:chromate transporter [Clostridia bacterium]